jgi:hypothetical protein
VLEAKEEASLLRKSQHAGLGAEIGGRFRKMAQELGARPDLNG